MMEFNDDHSRTIIHVDIDCFYAQVEMNKNPELHKKPLGIQQKNIVVTCNYIARDYGVKKCMLLEEAIKLCPSLVLVKGEDLHDYRQISYKITSFLQKYSPLVERLGLDENYIDVTHLVSAKSRECTDAKVVGHIFGDTSDVCLCGCEDRLTIGSSIAEEIRNSVRKEFNLTTCAGIAHNKLLSKLVGALHKPNQQTTMYPNSALELMCFLKKVGCIPSIGRAAVELLESLNVTTIEDLQNCDLERLSQSFGLEKAKSMKDLSFGWDPMPVKQTGRPQSIGLEDSCRSISIETEVRIKLQHLLNRILVLIQEDGRIPKTIKLTVRKFDKVNKISHRETRQCNVNPRLFSVGVLIKLTESAEQKLMSLIMHLFSKMVDMHKAYHITLLGLAFTKFQERVVGKNAITSFFKKNVEVQSLTSIENKIDNPSLLMDYSTNSQCDANTDGSESELEPSPKKSKFTTLIARRRCFNLGNEDCPSPSKLRVAELRLNSKDSDCSEKCANEDAPIKSDSNQNIKCPPNADVEVFEQLPIEVQEELWDDYKRERDRNQSFCNQKKKPKINTLFNYFVKN